MPLTRPMRALLLFVCVLVLIDTMFFTALTPLLPHYTHVDRKSTRLNSSHIQKSRMPSSA